MNVICSSRILLWKNAYPASNVVFSPVPMQHRRWARDISSQYRRIPWEERSWHWLNTSFSLLWRMNTSTSQRTRYAVKMSFVLLLRSRHKNARRASGLRKTLLGRSSAQRPPPRHLTSLRTDKHSTCVRPRSLGGRTGSFPASGSL